MAGEVAIEFQRGDGSGHVADGDGAAVGGFDRAAERDSRSGIDGERREFLAGVGADRAGDADRAGGVDLDPVVGARIVDGGAKSHGGGAIHGNQRTARVKVHIFVEGDRAHRAGVGCPLQGDAGSVLDQDVVDRLHVLEVDSVSGVDGERAERVRAAGIALKIDVTAAAGHRARLDAESVVRHGILDDAGEGDLVSVD